MTETRDQVSFLLNGKRHDVPRSVPPTRTLLDYLREDCSLRGTKEGCNEGDCGACTVVLGEWDGAAGVSYRAVNACIQFVPMVHGKSVVTVEGLHGPGGELHPVQRAMVECHGSQCGFCTPGFVMSLYAAYRETDDPPAATGDELLAGNLCRCTGYGSIAKAERQMREMPAPAWDENRATVEAEQLAALANGDLALECGGVKFFAPTALDEFAALYERYPAATILGGATDVGLWVTKQQRALTVLISTRRVAELRRHQVEGNRFLIHAGVSYSEAANALSTFWPSLGALVSRIGSVQVRNSGTIGGNVANGSPIGDMPPVLIALGATVNLRRGAERRSLPLEDYFIAYGKQDRQPGEFVEALEVPVGKPGDTRPRFYKITKRFDQDISAVLGCFDLDIKGGGVASARIAFGGMAATPKRAKAVEAVLVGKPWTLATVEAALPAFEADFQPISDMRASAAYRLQVAKNLLIRYFHETTSDALTRLAGPLPLWSE